MTTPHLGLPLLAAAQAQKHVTHNEALAGLDALVHLAVKERDRQAAPGMPTEGDRYLLGADPSGAFAGHSGEIALYDQGVWRFFKPRRGWRVFVEAEDSILVFDGAQWRDLGRYSRILDRIDRLGLGTAPDNINRLSAKLNAALFSALAAEEGGSGDLRFLLNKSWTNNVLSQLYQRGFSGRAETGLIGNDDFSIRVSPDGNQWRDALIIDRNTGVATFPAGLSNVSGSNLLINSAFRVNARGFAGGALAAGTYGYDRWRGGPSGCTITAAPDGIVTLTGAVEQVVEAGQVAPQVGFANFAGATLTLSVQDPSASLSVTIGSRTATIPPGSGRRSATVVLTAAETGNITVRLQAASSCAFRRVKLEIGSYATPWIGDPLDVEDMRCRRYYQRLSVAGSLTVLPSLGQRLGTNAIEVPCLLPVPMRAAPTLVANGLTWGNASPTGSQIAFFDNAAMGWVSLSGTLNVAANAVSPSSMILRLQASTSFSGASGVLGTLYLGSAASIALQAEL